MLTFEIIYIIMNIHPYSLGDSDLKTGRRVVLCSIPGRASRLNR